MLQREPLFKHRLLELALRAERARGVRIPPHAKDKIVHWVNQLARGVLDRVSESSAEQTFNNEIFGGVLGYEQIGTALEASFMPKQTGPSGRDTPDFVIGRFDPAAGIQDWVVVGEIKNARTDLDQPQVGRRNHETPVEQAFRYATKGKAGVEWIVVSNFREIRLYKNGYTGTYHRWLLEELVDEQVLFEFYLLLRPEGVLNRGRIPLSLRLFEDTVAAGRDITEGFYGLYRTVQSELVKALTLQQASVGLSATELYGKTHKLLNRILFIAFCEQSPACLLPRGTLRNVRNRGRNSSEEYTFWNAYKELFRTLNRGGGIDGVAYNAFNGGLFAEDAYFDRIALPNELFYKRFRAGRGRRQSLEITGIFGFDVYDFAEDLNVQTLGAIFEQSLKDIFRGPALVRGVGEVGITEQSSGGVYYTPSEITVYLVKRALDEKLGDIEKEARAYFASVHITPASGFEASGREIEEVKELLVFEEVADRLQTLAVIDPACGSGAFLVEILDQLHSRYEKINHTVARLRHLDQQVPSSDLDRRILRQNLHGHDVLPESVEISRLSIWLRTAAPGERLESLDTTITVADSLKLSDDQQYDIVIGNPPWGAVLEGWSHDEVRNRFPYSGEERDSFAIFVIRAWEMLRAGGLLAFVVPNSWLTVAGYDVFRNWLLRHFDILEINNVWKIFGDVNHDATLMLARKRATPVGEPWDRAASRRGMVIRSIARGQSEATKLKQIAEARWSINHFASHGFQHRQPLQRFEVIFPTSVADELDLINSRCSRLDEVADITVGIQVYHHTRVSRELIERRGFHSTSKQGNDWYPFIESNDVQRFFCKPSTTQWLQFSDRLRDKRDLEHYKQPRILIQQIFWRRLSAVLERPESPSLYLNTLFAVFNSQMPLECILGILNSRFISASYERRANRLFGDKFPKVSKVDLATIPIPQMPSEVATIIANAATSLQLKWQAFRSSLADVTAAVRSVSPRTSLLNFDNFWGMTETEFLATARLHIPNMSFPQVDLVRECYSKSKHVVDEGWHVILSEEAQLENLVRQAYGLNPESYASICASAPTPQISWALRD
jgi:hypothetical protein